LLEINDIESEADRRWYASVLLNRLMFVYFLQRRYFLDNGDVLYLQNKLKQCQSQEESFYEFLKDLFFQGFNDLEPLPNIDFNIMAGNSLIGLIRVDAEGFDRLSTPLSRSGRGAGGEGVLQGNLLQTLAASAYQQILEDKNAISTFPIVPDPTKQATLNIYRDVERGLIP
jgi:hypothetical protein